MDWDEEVDLVVAGSGAGGMAAALVAAVEGLSVILCEKTAQVGGTTATSGGAIWIPCSTEAREAGAIGDDSLDKARHYLRHELANYHDEALVEAYLTSGPAAIDYLRENSAVKFGYYPIPDYHSDEPGGTAGGRVLGPLEFDGALLGREFSRLRPPLPSLMVLGGMMFLRGEVHPLTKWYRNWKGFKLAAKLGLRHARARLRHKRGTRIVTGNALVGRFFYSLLQRDVPVWTNAPIADLVVEQGAVVGAVVEHGGRTKRIRTRRGVVLATGGPARDRDLMRELSPDFPHEDTMAFEGNTGEAHRIARKAGGVADTAVNSPAVWTPANFKPERDGTVSVNTYGFMDRGKPGCVAVNARGQRFVNEANSYQDVVMAMYARRHEDGLVAHLVCDRTFIRDYGFGVIPPNALSLRRYVRSGYVVEAPTLRALAASIGVDPDGLERTVVAHNRYAKTGIDLEFGKGSTAFNRDNGDIANKPNACLRPIATPPFYAMVMRPATLGLSVGLKTDADARVLDAQGRPIAGLWACGGEMTSVMKGFCPAGGVTLGPAIVFGYRAAMDAARPEVRAAAA